MGNMSYCRFQNTVGDLEDCYENMGNDLNSEEERDARRRILGLACDIALEFGDEIDREMVEI